MTSPISPTGTSWSSGSTTRMSAANIGRPHESSRSPTWSSWRRAVIAPVVSVRPYSWVNRHLNTSIDRRSRSREIGEAP
jgi:hypothetical protein